MALNAAVLVTKPVKARSARTVAVAPKTVRNISEHPRMVPAPVFRDALALAEEKGLLSGGRTLTVRGRMPAALVAQAKRKTGITSDSKLLEVALVSIAIADEYAEWLFSQRSTINPGLDLEF